MTRVLVAGAGGSIGVAWEVGVVAGLLDAGLDLREADLVIGTSAGSIVGARVAAGHDLSQARPESSPVVPTAEGGPDVEALRQVFRLWAGAREPAQMDSERRCAIGALAAGARTPLVEAWTAAIEGSTGICDWPARPFRVGAVDIESGRHVFHTRTSGAPFGAAIAASCAIPGLFPPVEIGGRRYMDGGVVSTTGAQAALDVEPDVVLVLMPMCRATISVGALAEQALAAETAALRARGARVCAILPDEGDVAEIGGNLMESDAARTRAVRERARERGRALARAEASLWNG